MNYLLGITSLLLALASLPKIVRADCDILDGKPRSAIGLSGCSYSDDAHRVCYTRHLDVFYTDASSNSSDVQHEVMEIEKFIDLAKSNDIKVVSTTVASMKCPEVAVPCFPLHTKTLASTKYEGLVSRTMSSLALGDDLVVGWGPDGQPVTSPIINFAHRSDGQLVPFVSLHTEKGLTVQGSAEHNIHVVTESGKRLETTFGKLAEHVSDPSLRSSPRFLRNPQTGPVEIISASWTTSVGFVAPITKKGSLLVLAEARTDLASSTRSVPDPVRANWIEVSCFSTVPDKLARGVHNIRMIPVYAGAWKANENVDGAGMGYIQDALAAVGSRLAGVMGHTATLHREEKSARHKNRQACCGWNTPTASEAFPEL